MSNKNMMWVAVGIAFFAGLVIGFVAMRQRAIGTMEAFKLETQRQVEEAKKMVSEDDEKIMGRGYILESGRLMLIEGEERTLVSESVTLSDGTTISVTGLVTRPDGSTAQLDEGESIWEDGTIMEAEEDSMMEEEPSAMEDNSSN